MFEIKLLVVIIFECIFYTCLAKYCEICRNHTLCKYKPGPSELCVDYNNNSALVPHEINDILDYINHRRNFVALGYSKFLPPAANMRKIKWSEELAIFAQRWADQCDVSTRPDKEDQCRDLAYTKVGQNIATIVGASPGLAVKHFVEVWFISSLDYTGSVYYYNKSRDGKSNYFTQLIWADTDAVGCGRVKFYANGKLLERLVCNFAPKGNIDRKPVYAIGYSASQCKNKMIPDNKFKGLCTHLIVQNAKLTTKSRLVTSLLRILNLSNDSIKHEIDSIHNRKNKKMRHVLFSTSKKRNTARRNFDYYDIYANMSGNHEKYFHKTEKSHARVHHSRNYSRKGGTTSEYNFRKYATSTHFVEDGIKYRPEDKCTRKHFESKHFETGNQNNKKCTRGLNNYNDRINLSTMPFIIPTRYEYNLCPCSTTQSTTYRLGCLCNLNKGLFNVDANTKCYPVLRSKENFGHLINERKKYTDLQHIDPFNIGTKSGQISLNTQDSGDVAIIENHGFSRREPYLINPYKRNLEHELNIRIRRQPDDHVTLKPFWQMDEYNDKKLELKSIKYTTLLNKNIRKSKTSARPSKKLSTEFITMKSRNKLSSRDSARPPSEKYLSFDELMHLRKFNTENYDSRRQMEGAYLRSDSTSPSPATSEITANTPFVRMKHCTRKLTCTWTAASNTDSDGNIIGGGGPGGNRGSRTPPGYVEGCTRTSTCTRDYMDRNKMVTPHVDNITIQDNTDSDEEDYCERRSLNINRRNLDDKISIPKTRFSNTFDQEFDATSKTEKPHECPCSGDLSRFKRNKDNHKKRDFHNEITYKDLYYLVFNKIKKIRDYSGRRMYIDDCVCNNSFKLFRDHIIIFILLFPNIILCILCPL